MGSQMASPAEASQQQKGSQVASPAEASQQQKGSQGASPAEASQRQKCPRRAPITESYMLTTRMVSVALRQLGAEIPKVDCFAEAGLHVWPKYWGPGSPHGEDAFQKGWNYEVQGALWWNPPFSRLDDVVDKIVSDKARGILIAPYWPQEAWYQTALPYVRKKWEWRRGSKLFETLEGPAGPTRWGVWAWAIDGGLPPQVGCRRHDDPDEEYRPRTSASRRRWRSKWKEEPIV